MELRKIKRRKNIYNDKRGFVIRDFMVSAVLFSGIFALFTLFIFGIADQHSNVSIVNERIATNYNQLEDSSSKIGTALSATTSGEGLDFRGAFDVAFAATFTVFQLTIGTLDLYAEVLLSFASDFGINSIVAGVFFTIGSLVIGIGIIWNWLSSISRGRI